MPIFHIIDDSYDITVLTQIEGKYLISDLITFRRNFGWFTPRCDKTFSNTDGVAMTMSYSCDDILRLVIIRLCVALKYVVVQDSYTNGLSTKINTFAVLQNKSFLVFVCLFLCSFCQRASLCVSIFVLFDNFWFWNKNQRSTSKLQEQELTYICDNTRYARMCNTSS